MTVTSVRAGQLTAPIGVILDWRESEIVDRYCRDQGVGREDGEACFAALKQFLVVCALAREPRAPSHAIDEMWHTALLFTRTYRDFCVRSFGRFIHHQPLSSPVDVSVYARTRAEAAKLFETLDDRYWVTLPENDCGGCKGDEVADCGGCSSVYDP